MIKRIVIALMLLQAVFAFTLDYTPRQMIIRTTEPVSARAEGFGLQSFDAFLQSKNVNEVKPVLKKSDNRYFVATFDEELDWDEIRNANRRFEGIDYIQPNYINKLYVTPNDPYFVNQQLDLVYVPEAWETVTGNDQIIVGVIDSGMFFTHPDLQNNVFYNSGEIPDNGIDDDNNGYIDDWRGWDFVDAPELESIALGDYTDQDNDATDENKHGTHVSGIICADTNNNLGVAGIMNSCRLLVIRAGFRTTEGYGYLQDDDSAAAIVYAADMGADVINLSWGDTNYSNIIADACQYAYDHGTIIVASAGNDPTAGLSYPAKLSTTIGVGAVDSYYNMAGFSSYGPSLDLMAPGQQILSTYDVLEDGTGTYYEQSGTSMAAPFVTGAVGLLLSINPDLDFHAVRAKLAQSADDLGDEGFDNYYGNGVLNVDRLVENEELPFIEITYPEESMGLNESFDIIGTVTAPNFFRYSVMYTDAILPGDMDWMDVENHTNTPTFHYDQVEDDVIATFNVQDLFPDGTYMIKVDILTTDGKRYNYRRSVRIDQSAPVLNTDYFGIFQRYEDEIPIYYIQAIYDEPVIMQADCITQSGQTYTIFSDYSDSLQIVPITGNIPEGVIDIQLSATNETGLTSVSEIFQNVVDIRFDSVNIHDYEQNISGVGLVPIPVRGSDDRRFIGMTMSSSYGPVQFYQIVNNQVVSIPGSTFSDQFWPLSCGDTDGERLEVLGLNLDTATLYEVAPAADPDSYAFIPMWNQANISGGKFTDYTGDGVDDVILVTNITSGRVLKLYRRSGANYVEQYTIYNGTTTLSRNLFVPTVFCDDFDGDGYKDILTADIDGDVIVYEFNGSEFEPVWNTRLPVTDTYYLTIGDFTGNRHTDFCVGGYQSDTSDPNKTFWYFGFFQASANNQYEQIDELMFSKVESQNSITSVDIDNDENDELIFSLSPNIYVIDYVDGKFVPVWRGSSDKSYNTVAFPPTDTESAAFLFNDVQNGINFASVGYSSDEFTGPPTPQGFRVAPVDQNTVQLDWSDVEAEGYRVYRRENSTITIIGETAATTYRDTGLTPGSTYEYAITTLDEHYDPNESRMTLWKEATVDIPPQLEWVRMVSPTSLRLKFDRKLNLDAINVGHYSVNHGIGNPESAIMTDTQEGVLLRFNSILTYYPDYLLTIDNLTGESGVPIENDEISFQFVNDVDPPNVQEIRIVEKNRIQVVFTETVASSAGNIGNYTLNLPSVDQQNSIVSVSHADSIVTIVFSKNLVYSSQPYQLVMRNIEDLYGNDLPNDSDIQAFSLTDLEPLRNLDHMVVYPNPFYAKDFHEVRFINLPSNQSGKIWIYNLNGDLVYRKALNSSTLTIVNNDVYFGWPATNNLGKDVASGVYFYVIKMGGERQKGTLSVIR